MFPFFYVPDTGKVHVAAGGEESTAAKDAQDANASFIWFFADLAPLDEDARIANLFSTEGLVNHTVDSKCPEGCYGQLPDCVYREKHTKEALDPYRTSFLETREGWTDGKQAFDNRFPTIEAFVQEFGIDALRSEEK